MKKPEEFITRLKELRFGGYRISQSIDTCLREWEGVEIVVPTEQAIEDKLYCLIWDDNGSFFSVSKIYTNKEADAIMLSYNNLSKITLREAIERKIIEL